VFAQFAEDDDGLPARCSDGQDERGVLVALDLLDATPTDGADDRTEGPAAPVR